MSTGNTKNTRDYNLRKTTTQKEQNCGGTLQSTPPRQAEAAILSTSGPTISGQPSMPQVPHPQPPAGAAGQQGDLQPAPIALSDSNTILLEMRKMSAELNRKLDHVIVDLDAVTNDIAAMKTKMQTLENSVEDTSARIATVETKSIPNIESRLNELKSYFDDKLMYQELHQRKQNLLLYGIPSQTNENVQQVTAKALAQILETPIEEAVKIPVVNSHRLPTKKPFVGASNAPAPPDPIIVRFARMTDRDRVLRAFEQPRQPRSASGNFAAGERITVRTDLPPQMKRERGRLATIAFNLRKTKHLKTKIAIHGTKVILLTKSPTEPSSSWATYVE